MLIPQYKDAILEILALTFVVGAATVGSVAGNPSGGRVKPGPADVAPRTLRSTAEPGRGPDEAGLTGKAPGLESDGQPPEDRSEMFTIIAYGVDASPTESAGAELESPTIEVVTIEPNGTCKIYTAWCDAEQVLLKINAQKERSHPSAPSPIP